MPLYPIKGGSSVRCSLEFQVIDEIVDYSRCSGSTEFRRRNSACNYDNGDRSRST